MSASSTASARYRRILGGGFFAVFVVQTGFGAILPLLPQFVHKHGFPLSDMGIMAASYAAVSFVGQVGLGPLTDRFGRRRAMVLGSVVEAAGTAGFLLHGSVLWFVFCRVLQGLGSAAIVPAANALVADFVPEEGRGRAYGWMAAAGSAGFAVGPMLGGLAGAEFGLGAPFVIGAVLNVVAAAATMLLLPGSRGHGGAHAAARARVLPLLRYLWPYFSVMFAWMGITGMYDTSWSLYMQWLGATKWVIGLSFTLFALPLLFFNIFGGRLADRVSRRHATILWGTGLQAITVVFYIISHSPWFSIAVSIIEAAAMSLTGPALSASVMDHSPDSVHGAVQGLFQASGTFGATLMALASGPLLVSRPNHPFYLGASVLLATTVGVGLVWRSGRRVAQKL
ncbi:MAG: MFS transporter [Firmicutes bacterium]|nr:MFS transporter [Bacillota bacterium]